MDIIDIKNAYEDSKFADAYSKLEFPGTYYLAFRDLPEIILNHTNGRRAIDFGCGAGRSTRFLERIGFKTTGVDIAEDMLKKACTFNPNGDYRLIEDGDLSDFKNNSIDLILSAFAFDNIPTLEHKIKILKEFRRILNTNGIFVNLVSSPEIYINEWSSFSTKDFPENHNAKSGDVVKIINTSIADSRPVEDIVVSDEDYRQLYQSAGLNIVNTFRPLAYPTEPIKWINETHIPPWVIYVLN
jgi:ubiquinone/menaquinone biosynthesis C-methylase UbiE